MTYYYRVPMFMAFALLLSAGCTDDTTPLEDDTTTQGTETEAGSEGDSSGSGPSGPSCGDGFRSAGEECDGNDFGTATCASLGAGTGGSLECTAQCTIDATSCTECGNGVLEGSESCDGFNLDGQTCESLGEGSGRLACLGCGFDTSGCMPLCGDGVAQDDETCDGSDLRGETCRSLFGQAGTLECSETCVYDDSGCNLCGNRQIDPGEECDTLKMDGKGLWFSCEELLGMNFSGQVVCGDDCSIDTSMCFECGDGVVEGLEDCDGAELGGTTCEDLGELPGTLACTESCAFDLSGCG